MKKYLVILFLAFSVFCGSREKNVSALSSEHQNNQANEQISHGQDELHLSSEQQKEWGIIIGTASKESITSKTQLPGVLRLNQNRTAHVSSFVEGKVVSYSADLGYRVKKGEVLLIINSPEFAQAQADFLQARSRLNLSLKEFERAKMLLEEKAIEEKEYLRRETEKEKLATEYGALGSALHSFGIEHDYIDKLIEKCDSMEMEGYMCELANPNLPILSPISGTIIYRDVVVGEHVNPDKILFSISNLDILWAILDAYEKDLPNINIKSRATIKSPLYPEKEFSGKITYIHDLIDENLRTIKIRVEVKNSENLLKPNMYIQSIIENEIPGDMHFVVPDEAVQNSNGKKIVFIFKEKDIFIARVVKAGDKIGNKRIILDGLDGSERIVVKGAFTLKAELTKGTIGHDHAH